MDQNESLPTPLDLPPVENEASIDDGNVVRQQGAERNPELLPSEGASSAGVSVSRPQSAAIPEPIAVSQTQDDVAQSQNTAAIPSPQIADDVDLIEKEWVEKAKEIVDKTKENPYLQNKAISEIKADYIKKRYNKDLAKSEE